jgi:hypothetical protein
MTDPARYGDQVDGLLAGAFELHERGIHAV